MSHLQVVLAIGAGLLAASLGAFCWATISIINKVWEWLSDTDKEAT